MKNENLFTEKSLLNKAYIELHGTKDIYIVTNIIEESHKYNRYIVKNSKLETFEILYFKIGIDSYKMNSFIKCSKYFDDSLFLPIYDYGEDNDHFFICYKHLKEDLKNTILTVNEIKKLANQFCYTIKFLHRNRLTHLSITPKNFYFDCIKERIYLGGFENIFDIEHENFEKVFYSQNTLQGIINDKSDYYSFGVCLLYFTLENKQEIYYTNFLEAICSIEDEQFKNILEGLIFKNYSYHELINFANNVNMVKNIQEDYEFDGRSYKSNTNIAVAFKKNWTKALEHLRLDYIAQYYEKYDKNIYEYINYCLENCEFLDSALTLIIYKLNPDLGICIDAKSYKDTEEIAKKMYDEYPNVDVKIYNLFKDKVLSQIYQTLYEKKNDEETLRYLTFITNVENNIDNGFTYFYFLFSHLKQGKYYFIYYNKKIFSLDDMISVMLEHAHLSRNMLEDLMGNDYFLSMLATKIKLTSVLHLINLKDDKLFYSFIEAISETTKKDLTPLVLTGFNIYLLKNYFRYKFKRRLPLLEKYENFNIDLDNLSLVKAFEVAKFSNELYYEFIENFSFDLLVDYKEDICAIEAADYIAYEENSQIVSKRYLKELGLNHFEETPIYEFEKCIILKKIDESIKALKGYESRVYTFLKENKRTYPEHLSKVMYLSDVTIVSIVISLVIAYLYKSSDKNFIAIVICITVYLILRSYLMIANMYKNRVDGIHQKISMTTDALVNDKEIVTNYQNPNFEFKRKDVLAKKLTHVDFKYFNAMKENNLKKLAKTKSFNDNLYSILAYLYISIIAASACYIANYIVSTHFDNNYQNYSYVIALVLPFVMNLFFNKVSRFKLIRKIINTIIFTLIVSGVIYFI